MNTVLTNILGYIGAAVWGVATYGFEFELSYLLALTASLAAYVVAAIGNPMQTRQ